MTEENKENAAPDYSLVEKNRKVINRNVFKMNPSPFYLGHKDGVERKEPEVSFLKDGESIKEIIVHCTCGKEIKIECE